MLRRLFPAPGRRVRDPPTYPESKQSSPGTRACWGRFVDATLPNSHRARSVGPLRLLVRIVLTILVDVGRVTVVVFIVVAPAVVLDVGLLPDGKVIHNRKVLSQPALILLALLDPLVEGGNDAPYVA